MRRVIRLIFGVADGVALLLGFVSVVVAVAYPIAAPLHARMAHGEIPTERIAFTAIIAIAVATGAFLLGRRKMSGLFLVLLPCVGWSFAGSPQTGLWYGAVVVLIFGSPFVLSYHELRHGRSNERA